MKIWGVAASRSREAPRPAVPDVPPPEPVGQRRPGVSHAGLRVLARLRREAPVDLRLDSQELRSAADIRAVVEACGAQPPKTLTLGPWGHGPSCSCHGGFGSGTPAVLPAESCELADAAIQAFLGCARIWGAWPLRSISLCELRGLGSEAAALGAQLARLRPPTLRLQHLGMRGSALATCLEALRGLRLELLDLSGNALEDEDLAMLLRLMSGSEPLQLSGLTLSTWAFRSESEELEEIQDTLPKVQKVNDDYLAMLRDVGRNEFYWKALESLPCAGLKVLDLGAGTGLLSLMAAKLGAKEVLAVEESEDMAQLVTQSAEHNAVQVQVLQGHSTSLRLAPEERADIIVSETFGVLLLQEGCLDSFVHAREHLAKPGAPILPCGGMQCATLLSSTALRTASGGLFTEQPDMSHVARLRDTGRVHFSVPGGFSVNALPDACAMSERLCVLELDFATSTLSDIPASRTFVLHALQEGCIDAVVTSWEVWADKQRKQILSTHAEDTKGQDWGFARDGHWGQGFQALVPLTVQKGQELRLTVRFADNGKACQFSLETDGSRKPMELDPRAEAEKSDAFKCEDYEAPWLCEAFIPLLCDVEAEGVEPDQRRYAEDLAPTFQSPLAEQRSVVVRSLNDDYFALINHPARLRFFRGALQALADSSGSVRVLDLGAGAGQLAALAAQLGHSVLALEACSELCTLARETAQRNGVQVQVEHAMSSCIHMEEKVDAILCEPYDIFLTGQGSGSLDYLIDARRRLAKPSATIIPSGGAQYARLVMAEELGMRSVRSVRSVSSRVSLENLGTLLDSVTLASSRTKGFRWSCLPDLVLQSEQLCLFTLDFQTLEPKHIPRTKSLELRALHDGFVDAVVTSWEMASGNLRFAAHAEETRHEEWGFASDVVFGQGLQLLVEEGDKPKPFEVKAGEVLTLTAHISERRDQLHFTLKRGPPAPKPKARGRAR
ncbi:unnamed protein product [Effrenium voratum]|uniref:Uncharacterized protein n=1 Tax=Effrenium voratum TaxID=2562239 RepID=A0AA36II90_9DINO|nr:unnamed protein product [Effrenium voratum]